MKQVIFSDEQILNESFRRGIIKEIEGDENRQRKAMANRRFEIFRDQVKKYVMQRLRAQGFKEDTIAIMLQRAANISICKKIVKKKARAYSNGVDRSIPGDEGGTLAVQELADMLGVSQQFKKGDEYRNLTRNATMFIHPLMEYQEEGYDGTSRGRYGMCVRTLHPHLYDVIPDAQNREKARCLILSEYPAGNPYPLVGAATWDGSPRTGYNSNIQSGDGVDQTIANSRADSGARPDERQYIWWTGKYHLTTDCEGALIASRSPADLRNPIQQLPFVNLAMDQDGEFWGEGGEDVIDGSILINVFMTDAAAILNMQGWGQPVLKGENLKGGNYPVGPQVMMELSYKNDQPEPKYEIVSTDPHTDMWLRIMEVYIALLLTTNNLSPRNISGKLDTSSVASGIAKMIDESESIDDITESQNYFIHREKEFWEIISEWLNAFRSAESLIPELETLPEFDGSEVNVKFKQGGIVLSEKEKLDIIELRKKLGINTMIELLKMDDPSLTDADAEKKLAAIAKDQLIQMANQKNTPPANNGQNQPPQNQAANGDAPKGAQDNEGSDTAS